MDETKIDEEKIIEKRKDNLIKFFKKRITWITYIILAGIIWLNVYIRTLPMKINPSTGKPYLWDITRDNWTLGPDLDPFLFLKWAKVIVEKGFLPDIDYMRYVPIGYHVRSEATLLSQAIAWLHEIILFFNKTASVEYAAVLLPVVASVFAAIGFFLLVRKIFQEKGEKISNIIGLIATAFMVMLPSLLPRTIAGIPEKESLGFGLMFFAFYFFLAAWKSKKNRNTVILGLVAGLFTALLGQVWGGVMFVYITLAIAGFIVFILEKVDEKAILTYVTWMVGSLLFWIPFSERMSIKGFLTSTTTGASVIVLFLMIVYFVLYKTKIKDSKYLKNKYAEKIHPVLLVVIVSGIIILILGSIFIGPGIFGSAINDIKLKLTNPYTERHALTVAENKQPYFDDWKGNFGPIVLNMPLFFWLFFIGSLYLFYEMVRKIKKKEKWILTLCYTIFLFAIIFSRSSSSSVFNGESTASIIFYLIGFLSLAGGVLYVLYSRYKEKNKEGFKDIQFEYIFIFALIFVGIIAGRNAIRFIMVLAPIAVIPLAYLIIISIKDAFDKKDELVKMLLVIFAIIICLASVYTFYYDYIASDGTARSYIPSAYNYQWQQAMSWVRDNTPKDAVFGHWWDYGYWVQAIGERATMLDGSNSYVYWDYLMGRHVLTGNNESEALEVLYNHNVTYFLIDSTDIGKYSAYASIGSDENYDRLSWINAFSMDEKQTQETNNLTLIVYTGGTVLDEDLIIKENDKEILLPKQKAGIGAVIIPFNGKDLSNSTNEQPYVIIVYQAKQYQQKLRYLFINGKLIDFKTGIPGCAYIFPRLDAGAQGGVSINVYGTSMYLSPRNMRALWVHIYLLGEGKNFELVHTESSPIVKSLRSQGLNSPSEFIYYQGIQGPIKIWKINYTGNEYYTEEYQRSDFPEEIKQRNLA